MTRNPWTIALWVTAGLLLAAGVIMIADSNAGGLVEDSASGWRMVELAGYAALAAGVVSALTWRPPSQGVGEAEHAQDHRAED